MWNDAPFGMSTTWNVRTARRAVVAVCLVGALAAAGCGRGCRSEEPSPPGGAVIRRPGRCGGGQAGSQAPAGRRRWHAAESGSARRPRPGRPPAACAARRPARSWRGARSRRSWSAPIGKPMPEEAEGTTGCTWPPARVAPRRQAQVTIAWNSPQDRAFGGRAAGRRRPGHRTRAAGGAARGARRRGGLEPRRGAHRPHRADPHHGHRLDGPGVTPPDRSHRPQDPRSPRRRAAPRPRHTTSRTTTTRRCRTWTTCSVRRKDNSKKRGRRNAEGGTSSEFGIRNAEVVRNVRSCGHPSPLA